MIICEECGNQNDATDTFCGSCGAFLEWQGQRVEEPAPEPEPEVEEAAGETNRPGIVQRVKTAIGIEDQPGGGDRPDAAGPVGPGTDEAAEAEEARRRAAAERAGAEEVAQRARRDADAARAEAERAERLAREQAEAAARAQADAEAEAARQAAEARQAEAEQRRAEEAAASRAREETEAAASRARREAEDAAAERARREVEEAAERRRREAEEDAVRAQREAEAARRRAEQVAAATAAAEAAAARARAEEAKREEAARRAAAMVAQPRKEAPPPPPPPTQAAVRPTEERQRPAPRPPAAPAPVVKPGDLICGQCGEGNDPTRNFCRRCGHTLATAVVARIPWYRRLFRRRKKALPAGARPARAGGTGGGTGGGAAGRRGAVREAKMAGRKAKSVYNKFRKVAALLVIFGVGLAFLGPFRGPANRAYQSVRRVIKPEFEPVRPVDAVASTSAPGRDPKAVIDGIKNTFWAEGAPGPGDKQTLTVTFSEPTDIDKFGIIPGASEDPAQFVAQPRPRVLHLVFNGETPSAKDVTVKDSAEFQSFDLKARGVTSVLVEMVSVHASTGGEDCAITELEFFRKK